MPRNSTRSFYKDEQDKPSEFCNDSTNNQRAYRLVTYCTSFGDHDCAGICYYANKCLRHLKKNPRLRYSRREKESRSKKSGSELEERVD